ncbi:AB1gp42 domain protein [Acinetobacter sp. 1130196]|uniref:hypothetical protein n=1 Tax=Acinetobacter sp. 1130196 TaxID=1310772 RepID=UPI00044C838A|nr:hypothetical protein [Acinetobacter sp. 1130196]EXR07503.1 AB1gp42 domain protein [Acinetobacter sp. 1130196]
MTLSEIREQLAVVAQRNGRPPYDLCVLKAVQFAVKNGTEHPLKEHLDIKQPTEIPKVEKKQPAVKAGPKVPQASQEDIKDLCDWISAQVGRQNQLAVKAGTSHSIIWRVRKSKTCTKRLYEQLLRAKNEIIEGASAQGGTCVEQQELMQIKTRLSKLYDKLGQVFNRLLQLEKDVRICL